MISGFLVVDKPAGITSHDVVAAIRAITGAKKVGHTGTLDPFATGVLPLAINTTKLIQYLDESLKIYDATIALGSQTDTGDPTGKVIEEAPVPEISEAMILQVLQSFVGPRMQTPPAYSAVKKNGQPLYKYARKGEKVEVPARPITIYDLHLISWDANTVRVKIECSRGTYARVLANEIAEALGTVGHLSALSRLRSGPFEISDAIDFPTLANLVSSEPGKTYQEVLLSRGKRSERVKWKSRDEVSSGLGKWLKRPIDCFGHLPIADVDVDGAKVIKSGGTPPLAAGIAPGARYLVVRGDRILAVAERGPDGGKVLRVF